jgi:hypothetical protein
MEKEKKLYVCGSCGESFFPKTCSCPHCDSHHIFPLSSNEGRRIYDEENHIEPRW